MPRGNSTLVTSIAIAGLLSLPSVGGLTAAEKKYNPGATDAEIKIGNTMPYSGSLSSFSTMGRVEAAYFTMLNEKGGINGRKINFISYDDAFNPAKTVEQTRKLVEGDEVLLLFNTFGTQTNSAIHKYVNAKKIPHLFLASGAAKWADPKTFPWTMGWQPQFRDEARIYGKYIAANYPGAKIGVLYQNDDFGKDCLDGLREGLGPEAAKQIVSSLSYETSSPTIDSQIVQIKAAEPTIFANFTTPKFSAQVIRKIAELGWKPIHFLQNGSASVAGVMKPAGYENAQDILSAAYAKDPTDPQWKNDPAMKEWRAFMTKYYPDGDQSDLFNILGYGLAKGIEQVLRQSGDELTRENIMRQATNLNLAIDVYLPGIRVQTSQTDHTPLEQLQMMRFKGQNWELFGQVIDSSTK